jgi:hypothetical protein
MVSVKFDISTLRGNTFVIYRIKDGRQPIQKKGRGRLIHILDFINPETGRLTIHNADGNLACNACKIIYPSSDGDPWWDTKQLLAQMEDVIDVFEEAHPNKQALFIFDQSSAHASLPPDALKAFKMNKSDGGKQQKQQNTVIPMSNPSVEQHSKPQLMTLPDGQPKGLQTVLEECSFTDL